MTDEGRHGDPLDAVELAKGLRDAAAAARMMYDGLREEGFTEAQSLELVKSWLHGSAGGKS